MGYHLNSLGEPVIMAGSKPMLTEFGIRQRLESCALIFKLSSSNQGFKIISVIIKPTHYTVGLGTKTLNLNDMCISKGIWKPDFFRQNTFICLSLLQFS